MRTSASLVFALSFFVLLASPLVALGANPEGKGFRIAKEADTRDSGFRDFTADMIMALGDNNGDRSIRAIRMKTLEVPYDGDKTLVIFDSPRDVKGTAFLSYTHRQGDDDQWLYLPALRRVKRISSSNRSGSFMGSEFSYEDISSQEVNKYTYDWLRDEPCEGGECFVIERYPVDRQNSGYTRETVWIDKEEYRTWKVEYYDRKDALLKTLVFKGYRKYGGRFWRPDEMFMENHQNGKTTLLEWSAYRFGLGLTDRDFDHNSLKRAR